MPHKSIFPEKDTLEEANEYIESQLPITDFNTFYVLSRMYENTVNKVKESQSVKRKANVSA